MQSIFKGKIASNLSLAFKSELAWEGRVFQANHTVALSHSTLTLGKPPSVSCLVGPLYTVVGGRNLHMWNGNFTKISLKYLGEIGLFL